MKPIEYIFAFLIFPGFLFSTVMGMLVGVLDRKVTARIQWRVGPPWYQNFFDALKLLLCKETLVPEGASKAVFFGMPLLATASASLVSTMIIISNYIPQKSFIGDLIVVVYLLMIPPLALMLGGFASANPLASLGASREMKLILSYELPFILSMAIPIMKSGYCIKLGEIIAYQAANGPIISSLSGTISFIVMLISLHAKLGITPFDIAEAETEIISGPYIEYSGKALGIFKLGRAILIFAAPLLLMTLYLGGSDIGRKGLVKVILEYLAIVVLTVLIKNTNPRLRIDQAMKFFWSVLMVLAVSAIILAYLGY